MSNSDFSTDVFENLIATEQNSAFFHVFFEESCCKFFNLRRKAHDLRKNFTKNWKNHDNFLSF